jgi:hypothetical protein
LFEAEVTLVAAEATVRGVTVAVRPVVARPVVVRPVVVRFAELRAAPAVLLAADGLAAVVFAAPDGLALPVRALEPARAGLALGTGSALAAAFFVGGTDLPPIWIS